jgi:hypothetical protein
LQAPKGGVIYGPAFFVLQVALDEAPRSKLRGIKAELRHSQPGFALKSFAVVRQCYDSDILCFAGSTVRNANKQ